MRTFRHPYARGNPFRFPTAAPSSRIWFAGVLMVMMLLTGLSYWLFFSSQFAIRAIKIQANLALSQEQIRALVQAQLAQYRLDVFPQRNIFAFDTEELRQRLAQAFLIEQVFIKKERPHTIAVTITETPRQALWSSRDQYYALDAQGTILGAVPRPKTPAEIVIYDKSGAVPEKEAAVLSVQAFTFIAQLRVHEIMKRLDPRVWSVEKAGASELTVKVAEGWRINFNMAGDLVDQIKNLDLILRHSIPPDKRATLDYIELRFGERVYFKYK